MPSSVMASGATPSDTTDGVNRQNTGDSWATFSNSSHLSSLDVNPNMSNVDNIIFGNTSCILNPEATIGPYYISGEYVRSDISEGQAGIPLYMHQQYINVKTCEPIEGLYADIWHCNATGVYGGIVAKGNGNINDASNINATFLRGLQRTDGLGIVSFKTIFPGFYPGRTTHIHMVTHTDATQLSNGTVVGGSIAHIGQLMFDQDLTNEINDNVYPYTSNTQSLTTNEQDSVFIAETQTNSDPVIDWVKLSHSREDGIFGWIQIGIDPDASYEAYVAGVLSDPVMC